MALASTSLYPGKLSTAACITPSSYSSLEKNLLKDLLFYGMPGQEIFENNRLKPPLPTEFIVEPIPDSILGYSNALSILSKYDRDSNDKGRLSDRGYDAYKRDLSNYDRVILAYDEQVDKLLPFLFYCLSPTSMALLEAKSGFQLALRQKDSFAIFELLRETHRGTSAYAKHASLLQLLQVRQSKAHTFHEFLSTFQDAADLVLARFGGSGAYAGFLAMDDIKKALFLESVDKQIFQSQIDSVLQDDAKSYTLVVEQFSAYYVGLALHEKAPATAYQSHALVSAAPTKSLRMERPYGPFDSSRASCRHCWKHGYCTMAHDDSSCIYKQRSEQKSLVSPVTDPLPVASSTTAGSDSLLSVIKDVAFCAVMDSCVHPSEASVLLSSIQGLSALLSNVRFPAPVLKSLY